MTDRPTWNSVVVTVLLVATCAAIGVFVLPLIFGPTPGDLMTPVWLVVAILLSILVIALTLQLSSPLAAELGRGIGSPRIMTSQTALLARLMVFGLALVTTQAIVRRPIALIVGGDHSATSIESGIAAAALAAVLVTLVWVYQTARPMVQVVTLRAIDAAIPTTGTPLLAEPTRTSVSVVSSGPIPSATDAVTVVAPLFVTAAAEVPTLVSGRVTDATEVAGHGNSDVTVPGKRPRRFEDEATVVRGEPDNSDDPTRRVLGA